MQKKKDDGPEFYPVTGRVTHNGGPLEGTFQITFFPLSENNEEIASGRLFEDGTYKLFSGQLGVSGARAGEYRVCVRRIREKGEDEYMNFDMKTTKVDPRDGGTMTPEEPKTPFDKAVTDPKKTPHRAVVVEGDNVIDVQL